MLFPVSAHSQSIDEQYCSRQDPRPLSFVRLKLRLKSEPAKTTSRRIPIPVEHDRSRTKRGGIQTRPRVLQSGEILVCLSRVY